MGTTIPGRSKESGSFFLNAWKKHFTFPGEGEMTVHTPLHVGKSLICPALHGISECCLELPTTSDFQVCKYMPRWCQETYSCSSQSKIKGTLTFWIIHFTSDVEKIWRDLLSQLLLHSTSFWCLLLQNNRASSIPLHMQIKFGCFFL